MKRRGDAVHFMPANISADLGDLRPDSSRPARTSAENHRAALAVARRHMGHVAWPTVFVSLGSLTGLAVSSAAGLTGFWPLWVSMLVNGYLLLMQFMAVHDGIHDAISGDDRRYKWLNDALAWIGGIATLIPYRGYDVMHLVHHRYTNDFERDPDTWCASGNPLALVLRFFTQTPHYIYLMTRMGMWKDPAHRREYFIAGAHHLAAWTLVAVGFVQGWGWEILMLWIFPTFLNVALIGLVFNYLPHRPHLSQERYRDSGVFLLPRAIHRLVTVLDMYQTYHLIHHLFPRIPFYRIGAAFHEMRPILEAEGAAIHDWTHAWDRKRGAVPARPVAGVAPGARMARTGTAEGARASAEAERRANTV
ncbi:fatty acid desaturase [Parvibaculum sp.]|uniref:fatty acid desaturase n=1 Tax=Parvibaculum sp. TaxID=2024848 RepID=UPI002730AD75|nr:fatty acid desaturase [Parvibaculum sp.]MDP1627124.1 fatty acid desaturase [Parvibaculum sp.]MDP2149285.1 fatty acid desaturase [Parvibaculum sp.]MDP3329933.1 fatty acid desaturase [Parvibaculum sp.]